MVTFKLLEVVAKKISSTQIKAHDIVTGLVGAKKLQPLKSGFEKARKTMGGEFEMVSVTLWQNETLNKKSPP